MTVVFNEKVILYEPDYIIKGIPEVFDGRQGDFFVSGVTCSRASDTCTVYSQSTAFEYRYPVNNSFILVRTKPSLHVKLFINSPKTRAAELAKLTVGPGTSL